MGKKSIKCVCCGKKIKSLSKGEYAPETDMWGGGGVHEFIPGFGSKYDSKRFIVGICDECIEEKINNKSLKEIKY